MLLILLVVRMVLQKDLVLDTLLDLGMNKQELENKSYTTLVYAAYATVSAFAYRYYYRHLICYSTCYASLKKYPS